MGRPLSLTDGVDDTGAGVRTAMVQGVQYDYAGRLSGLQQYEGFDGSVNDYAQEARAYNVNGQLTSQSWGICEQTYCYSYGVGIQYAYSATQNNGQITQTVDAISGETIAYQYDALKRLTSASSTPKNGSSPSPYTETFQYDGFGNLTAKVLNGTTTSIPVNAASNQLTNAYYDANGNMTSGAGATFTYDEANRISSVAETSGGQETYGYDPANKRIYHLTASGLELFTFSGAKGEKLGNFTLGTGTCTSTYYSYFGTPCNYTFAAQTTDVWFAGKLIWDSNNPVIQDRLGTDRASWVSYYSYPATRFYPFGDEITSTSNDREKFATYTRDSYTGLDYADQRFYASTYGRFNTPDPSIAGGAASGSVSNPSDPGSWNRFAYTRGDPINRFDPRGTDDCAVIFADASLAYDPYSGCSGPQGNCPNIGMAFAGDPDDATFWAQAEAMGCTNAVETAAPPPPPPPTCGDVLLSQVQIFLQVQDPALLSWDPNLASQFVTVGAADGVDPRLMASIATLESGHSTVFGGTNNPFGLGPKWNFPNPLAAVKSQGITLKHLIGYGDTTVSALYSGKAGVVNPSHPGVFLQPPGYCYGAGCQAGGQAVSGFLSSFGSAPGVGLTAGNPSSLAYPCP